MFFLLSLSLLRLIYEINLVSVFLCVHAFSRISVGGKAHLCQEITWSSVFFETNVVDGKA